MSKVNNQEGDGIAAPKSMTAWAVEVDGKIDLCNVVDNRSFARELRSEAEYYTNKKCHVRKVELRVVAGR